MKRLIFGAIFCAAFTFYWEYTNAHALQKREASPFADPNPWISDKVGGFCNETMKDATSPKDFCKAVSKRIVEKVNDLCKSSIKFACKVLVGKKYKKCKMWLYNNICPVVDGASTENPFPEDDVVPDDVPALPAPEDVAPPKRK